MSESSLLAAQPAEIVGEWTAPSLIGEWAIAAAPPPNFTVSQWAEAKRRLPDTSAAQGGRWRNATTPALIGVMDAVHEPGVRKILLKKAAQTGGSESAHNIIGFHMEHEPCPMLVMHPTMQVAEKWSKERLDDMIRKTPALKAVVSSKRGSGGDDEELPESTIDLKMFSGGYLAVAGANSPNSYARWAARLVFGDDIDRFPAIVGDEGDPLDLLWNRTRTFQDHNPIGIFVSTPTLKGGRTDMTYRMSDQRRFFVTCPFCGHEDHITWNGKCDNHERCAGPHFAIKYDAGNGLEIPEIAETARLECPKCGEWMSEAMRRQMITDAAAREDRGWRPTATAKEEGLVGFHLPAWLSTLGVTMQGITEAWLTSREKGRESLRVWLNTTAGEAWEETGTRADPHELLKRREDYGDGVEVPGWCAVLTAGVDTQDDRFEVQVWGWGPGHERAVIDYVVVWGSTKQPDTYTRLLEALDRKYRHASGVDLAIVSTCIDSQGHSADEVYAFVHRYERVRRIYATKGYAGKSGDPIVGKPSKREASKKKDAPPVLLYPINTDDAKSDIMASLSLTLKQPIGELATGPNLTHFPAGVDTIHEEYFAQLCSEHREEIRNKAKVAVGARWVQDRERNEALDTAVLNLAAFRILNPNVRQLAEKIRAAAAEMPVPARVAAAARTEPPADAPPVTPPPQPTSPRPTARRRRISHSPYLNR